MDKKESKNIITFKEIFSYRSVWMFLAILWVVFFHSPYRFSGIIGLFQDLGYGGVDIFLFASGVGCFFSLNKQGSPFDFLKRRFSSVFPMWAVFLTAFSLFKIITADMGAKEFLGNIFGFGSFAGLDNQFNWYIGGMWTCYLLAPIFVDTAKRNKPFSNFLLILFLIVFSFVFAGEYMLIFYSRLPIFFIGILCAKLSFKKEGVTLKKAIFTLLLMLIGATLLGVFAFCYKENLSRFGLWWYPFILITPGIVLIISILSKLISKTRIKPLINAANTLGHHTFSLYLSHIFVFDVYSYLREKGLLENSIFNYIISLAVSFAFAFILALLTHLLKKLFAIIKDKKAIKEGDAL